MIRDYETLATHTRNGYEWKLITDRRDGGMSLSIEYANGETMECIDMEPEDLERLRELFAVAITNKAEAVN